MIALVLPLPSSKWREAFMKEKDGRMEALKLEALPQKLWKQLGFDGRIVQPI